MRGNILGFGEVGRALIKVLVQIIDLNPNPVRDAIVRVATMIVGGRWISAGEWINPAARADAVLPTIKVGRVWVRAS
jgi:hypothetical protein